MEKAELERTDIKPQERNEKSKTIILTLILSVFFIGGVGTWGYYALFGAKSASDFNLPSTEEVLEAEKKSGTPIYKPTMAVTIMEIQKRINDMHEYWNSELGYDQWTNYRIDANKGELKGIANDIRSDILPYVTGPLQKDIENAASKIDQSLETKGVEPLKGVHRIFHDLDITLNGYQQASEYWEVTETWAWFQKAAAQ
ncbi:hypothetical protein KUV80_10195 [Fictibacillus nanhaiensis]|uniref:hypothetical protein n=1 Tax=Fictibacillus nanhaiensis TaxID=742169 RepID=UPI001C974BD8|nr:hypothetical protein [Fictibacillus nanhaiensis]MBY6037028.1 hypothetical protein [Fictibacillus nanhaiensis]